MQASVVYYHEQGSKLAKGVRIVLGHVAPTPLDIYPTTSWSKDALVQPQPRKAYAGLLKQGWTDSLRTLHPDKRLYTFWTYWRNRYERDDGQLLSGSFMDYAMPRAKDGVNFALESHPVPTKLNPVGAKGCGEAGCSGGLPTVINAVIDALSEYGIRHLEMPATPQRVWQAIHDAQAGNTGAGA